MLLGQAVGAPLQEWQQMVELNVLGLLYCAHEALPPPAARGRGRPAPRRRHGEHQLGGGPGRPQRQQRATPDQARRRRVQRVPAPGGDQAPRARLLVEPGATATELASHNQPRCSRSISSQFGPRMEAEDIADAITYIVTRPRHVAINEMLIRPTEQERVARRGHRPGAFSRQG